MSDINDTEDSMDDDQHQDDDAQQHPHWTTTDYYKSNIHSMDAMKPQTLEDIIQTNMCMMGLRTHSRSSKKNMVLCLGKTCNTTIRNKVDYQYDLEDLHIRNPDEFTSNNFINMGLSYNELKKMKTEVQTNMYMSSEMFGGGIFNDNVTHNTKIYSGFSGICTDLNNTMKKTNGVLFTNYIIAAMFNLLVRLDTSSNGVLALQDSIREGIGIPCVDLVEFHPLFPEDILLSGPRAHEWFKEISHRINYIHENIDEKSSFHDMLMKHKKITDDYKKELKEFQPDIISSFYTPDEAKYINIALCVYKYMNDLKMELHQASTDVVSIFSQIELYNDHNHELYKTEKIYVRIMKSVDLLMKFSNKVLTGYYESTDESVHDNIVNTKSDIIRTLVHDACKYTGHVTLNSIDPFGICLNVISDRDKVLELKEKTTVNIKADNTEKFDNICKYSYMVTLMENFGCDYKDSEDVQLIMIQLAEKASKAFITYDTQIRSWSSSIYESKMSKTPLRNTSRYDHENLFMSKHFEEISPIMKLDCLTAQAIGLQADELKKLYDWGYKDNSHEDGNMIAKLKKDMSIGTPLATQAINVTNANNNQCIHMPNLHISRCTALSENDMQKSCSSTDPTMWLIQQMAGIMPLTTKMCKSLMTMSTDSQNDHQERLKATKSK